MDALKKFISKKKADVKFKTAGPGHKLASDGSQTTQGSNRLPTSSGASSSAPSRPRNSSTGPSEEKRQAAAAALARLEKQKKPDVSEKDRLAARQLAFVKGMIGIMIANTYINNLFTNIDLEHDL